MGDFDSTTLPPRRPMRIATKIGLFNRQVKVVLNSIACELLFEKASVLIEGQREGNEVLGTIMVTFELSDIEEALSDSVCPQTVQILRRQLEENSIAQKMLKKLVVQYAENFAEQPVSSLQTDAVFESTGERILIDINFDGRVAVSQKRAS